MRVRMYGGRNKGTPRGGVAVVRCFGMIFNILILITCSHYVCFVGNHFFFWLCSSAASCFFFVCLILGIPSLFHFDVNVHTNSDVNVELVVWSVCLVCWVARFGWLDFCRGLVEGRHGHRAGHHRHLATLKKHAKLHCHR